MADLVKPVDLNLVLTPDSMSFQAMPSGTTGIPIKDHVGAFGVTRKHHIHEGVDIYVPEGSVVRAMLPGHVKKVQAFTGGQAGSPWWLDTQAVFLQTAVGMIVYGEIQACVQPGMTVSGGHILGTVKRVLRTDKGRPTAMLHLELRNHDSLDVINWELNTQQPEALLDPTPLLIRALDFNAK